MTTDTFDYPAALNAFWRVYAGTHSMLRCAGPPCPGGCGVNARDDMAAIHDARRDRATADQLERLARLQRLAHPATVTLRPISPPEAP